MNVIFAIGIGGGELVLILVVVLMLFGSKKMPELAKGLGQGIREFKKASREVTDELHRSMEEDHAPPPRNVTPPSPRPEVSTETTESAKAATPSTPDTKV